ncbi:MAG: hypothetical protein Alpg2KO_19490 [Alphaproteobacteria bacterium]
MSSKLFKHGLQTLAVAAMLTLPALPADAQSNIQRVETARFKAGVQIGLCIGGFNGFDWLLMGLGDAPEVDDYVDIFPITSALKRQLLDKLQQERSAMIEESDTAHAEYASGYIQGHEEQVPKMFNAFAKDPDAMPLRVRKLVASCNRLIPAEQRQNLTEDGEIAQ